MTGRKIYFLIVLAISAIILFLIYHFGRIFVMRFWNIALYEHTFIDLRGVLTGMEAARAGYDPLRENPFDPFGRPVPYPRIWFILSRLGLAEVHTEFIASVLITACILALPFAFKEFNLQITLWLVALTFSPGIMIGISNANLDMVILIIISILLSIRFKLPTLSFLLLELVAFLKLYPVFGFGYLLVENKRKSLSKIFLALSIFLIYVTLTWQDTAWIFGHAPKEALYNYGVTVISFRIFELTDSENLSKAFILPLYLIAYGIFIYVLYRSSQYSGSSVSKSRHIDGFRLGVLIYLGTFIQGNTNNYRLMFLLFAIPQMVDWYQNQEKLKWPALIALISLLLSAWGTYWGQVFPIELGFYLDEFVNWILFGFLLYLFLVSCPVWIRDEISSAFQRYITRIHGMRSVK